jgi:predicted phage-related endonuclease
MVCTSAKLIFIFSKFKIGCKSLKCQKNFVLKKCSNPLVTVQLSENTEACFGHWKMQKVPRNEKQQRTCDKCRKTNAN